MQNNSVKIYTYSIGSRFESNGTLTRLVDIPQTGDCVGVHGPNLLSDPNDLWCNQRCSNDRFYAQPIRDGQSIKIQTRLRDARNFLGDVEINKPCGDLQRGFARWSFLIVDRPGIPWGHRIGIGQCDCGDLVPPDDIDDAVWTITPAQCSPNYTLWQQVRTVSNLSIGCATDFDNYVIRAFAQFQHTQPPSCLNIFPGIIESLSLQQTTYQGRNAYKIDVIFTIEKIEERYGPNICVNGFCQQFSLNKLDQNSFPVPEFVSIDNLLCCPIEEPRPSPCYLFGQSGCDEAVEGFASFIFQIEDDENLVYGAANQELAGVGDAGFHFDIESIGCNELQFQDIPNELKLSNATDYQDYIQNVFLWLQSYVQQFGDSYVIESNGEFIIYWDLEHFSETEINICQKEPNICLFTNGGCIKNEELQFGFYISYPPSIYSYAIVIGNVLIDTIPYNQIDNGPYPMCHVQDYINSNIVGMTQVCYQNYIRINVDTQLFPLICNESIKIVDSNNYQINAATSVGNVFWDGVPPNPENEKQCCVDNCCESLEFYNRVNIKIQQGAISQAFSFASIFGKITFLCDEGVYEIENIKPSSNSYEGLLTSLNGIQNTQVQDRFFAPYVENGEIVGIQIFISTDFFDECDCQNIIVKYENLLMPQETVTFTSWSYQPICCENPCEFPCDLSHVRIEFSELDTLEFGNPDNDACIYIGIPESECPETCDTVAGICLSEYADYNEFIEQITQYLINLTFGGNKKGFMRWNNTAEFNGMAYFDLYLPKDLYPCEQDFNICQTSCCEPEPCTGSIAWQWSEIDSNQILGVECAWSIEYNCGLGWNELIQLDTQQFDTLEEADIAFGSELAPLDIGFGSDTRFHIQMECDKLVELCGNPYDGCDTDLQFRIVGNSDCEPEPCSGGIRWDFSAAQLAAFYGVFSNWGFAYQCSGSYSTLAATTAQAYGDANALAAGMYGAILTAGISGVVVDDDGSGNIFINMTCDAAFTLCGTYDCDDIGQFRIQNSVPTTRTVNKTSCTITPPTECPDCEIEILSEFEICDIVTGIDCEEIEQTIDFTLQNDGELMCCTNPSAGSIETQQVQVSYGSQPNPMCCPPFAFKIEVTDCCGNVNENYNAVSAIINQYVAKYDDGNFVQGVELDVDYLPDCFGLKISNTLDQQLYSECYKKECCKDLIQICGVWNNETTDCEGNLYHNEYTDICGEWFRHDDCIYIYGELKLIGYDINSESNTSSSSKTLTNKYRFSTGLVPPYVVQQIAMRFMAPKVLINGKEFQVSGQQFNEDRETMQMQRLQVELTEVVCDKQDKC